MSLAPQPSPDQESSLFWQSLADHHIVIQRCPFCRRHRFPRMPSCPYCGELGGEDIEVAGTGTVYSWVRVLRALTPAMQSEVPYSIVTVDLDGGARMFGRLTDPEPINIGMRVGPRFIDHGDWTELGFQSLGLDRPMDASA